MPTTTDEIGYSDADIDTIQRVGRDEDGSTVLSLGILDKLCGQAKSANALRAALREALDIASDERWTSRDPSIREAQKVRIAELRKLCTDA